MCYIDKSIEQVTSTCAMCKVFPPRRDYPCSHKDNMGVCKNRVNHPRHDVVYFRNAELTSFNGCGYCKWAKRNPKVLASPDSAWRNPGWPGCCRPPKSNEYEYINAADWYAITKIHGVIAPLLPTRTTKSGPSPIVPPLSVERRNSNPVSSRRSSDAPPTVTTTTITTSSSSPSSSSTTQGTRPPPLVTRETTIITLSPKSPSKTATSSSTVASSSPSSSSSTPSSIERRVSTKTYPITETPFATLRGPPPGLITSNTSPSITPPRSANTAPKLSTSISSSSSSRSSGSGSVTQSETVTSEGFTDYLSDESEAEMQREAERRANEAEMVARLQRTKLELGREEQEFRAARNQLATVGLQPPPAWSSGKPVNNNSPAVKEQTSPPLPQPPTNTTPSASSSSISTSRPSKSTALYNTPMVQVYASVRQ